MKELKYAFSDQMVALIADIAELLGKLSVTKRTTLDATSLHRNRVLQIHGSLALDDSTLTTKQVADFMDGKKIKIPMGEEDVESASAVYSILGQLDAYRVQDLLAAHAIMMHTQNTEVGGFRRYPSYAHYRQVPGAREESAPEEIPQLVEDLLTWAHDSDAHPLIKSCVVHCELMQIRPFYAGNGRISRLWQTLLLSQYKEIFSWLPVDSYVNNQRDDYLSMLQRARGDENKTEFILFMLKMIRAALEQTWAIESGIVGLSEKEIERWSFIQDYITIHGGISNANVRSLFNVSSATANRILTLYHEKGLLERVFISNHIGYIQRNRQLLCECTENG